MCIIALAIGQHPLFPLIVAANRDEFLTRPTQAMHSWNDAAGIIAGRDLQAGGTWLGINRARRFAALTNFRDPREKRDGARSRGQIVVDALQSAQTCEQFLRGLSATRTQFNGYTLVVGDATSCYGYESKYDRIHKFESGIFVISNGAFGDAWPKTQRLGASLRSAVERLESDAPLFSALDDVQQAADAQLPATGIALDRERHLSSVFVPSLNNYGTRTQAIVRISAQSAEICERDVFSRELRQFFT